MFKNIFPHTSVTKLHKFWYKEDQFEDAVNILYESIVTISISVGKCQKNENPFTQPIHRVAIFNDHR